MQHAFEITTTNGQFYYDLFYFIAIVFAGVLFMLDGKRKNYPLAEWSLIFSSGIVFLIIGTKLFTYTPDDWKVIVSTYTFPYTERKTILGGILGAILGIWIAKRLIRFSHPVLDSFAVSFPVAMAIQRIGCLLVGCCYGTPTNIPWAITYRCHTIPYFTHLQHGLVNGSSCTSLPVHPNQLYQTFLCLLIAFVVWRLKDFFKRPGNLFFTSIGLYWVIRFVVEFWRDSASNGIAGVEWMGLKYVQWGLLGAILLMSVFVFIRERRFVTNNINAIALNNPVWYFILLCLFILLASNWFTKTEFLFIELVLAPAIILQINNLIERQSYDLKYRLGYVYTLLFVLILNGSVTAQKTYEEPEKYKDDRSSFSDVSFGYGSFQYSHYHSAPGWHQGTGCGDPSFNFPVGPLYKHQSSAFGAGFAFTERYGKYDKLTLSGQFSDGWDTYHDSGVKYTLGIYDFAPSVRYDFRWFGLGIGMHAGSTVNEKYRAGIYYETEHTHLNYSNWSGSVRFFPYDIFYTEFRYNEFFPYQVAIKSDQAFQIAFGSSFGYTNGSKLEVGFDGNGGAFVSAKALINDKIGLSATYYDCKKNGTINQLMQFSVSYRFNQKHWKMKPIDE